MVLSDKFKLSETKEYNAMRTMKNGKNHFFRQHIQCLTNITKATVKYFFETFYIVLKNLHKGFVSK